MKKLFLLMFVFLFTALFGNAGVDWKKFNNGCYSIQGYELDKDMYIKIKLSNTEWENFKSAVNYKDPMVDKSLVVFENGTLIFKDLNAFVSADYLSKEKRVNYLRSNYLNPVISDGGINYCEIVFSAALKARLQGVIEYCTDNKVAAVRFDDLIDFGITNNWQTWGLQLACSGNLAANKYMLNKNPEIIHKDTLTDGLGPVHFYIGDALNAPFQDAGFCSFVLKKCKADTDCTIALQGLTSGNDRLNNKIKRCLKYPNASVIAQEKDFKNDVIEDVKGSYMALDSEGIKSELLDQI